MLSTFAQTHCMRHGQVAPDEDGECPLCLAELDYRLDEMAAREEHLARMKGHVECWCGSWVPPGARHYPGCDPENGLAHIQSATPDE